MTTQREVASTVRKLIASMDRIDRELGAFWVDPEDGEGITEQVSHRAGVVFAAAGYGEERPVALFDGLLVVRTSDSRVSGLRTVPYADVWSTDTPHGRRMRGRWPRPPVGTKLLLFPAANCLVFVREAAEAVREANSGRRAPLRDCGGFTAATSVHGIHNRGRPCRHRQRGRECGAHSAQSRAHAVGYLRSVPSATFTQLPTRPRCEFCHRATAEALLLGDWQDIAICWTCSPALPWAAARRVEICDPPT